MVLRMGRRVVALAVALGLVLGAAAACPRDEWGPTDKPGKTWRQWQ